MSDIRCVVCGEPWDAWGVRHGDMLPWEGKLFRQGAGCPSCEGTPNGFTPSTLSDLENGDEDLDFSSYSEPEESDKVIARHAADCPKCGGDFRQAEKHLADGPLFATWQASGGKVGA